MSGRVLGEAFGLGFGAPAKAGPARRNAPGFALLLAVLFALQGCALFRPSPKAQCRRANGLINRAVRICPESAALRTDTHAVVLPGDTASGGALFAWPAIDSILAACDSVASALQRERDHYADGMHRASALLIGQQHRVDSLLRPQPRRDAIATPVAAMRRQLCAFPTIIDSSAAHILRIWWTPQGPRHNLIIRPRAAIITTTTLPITTGPVAVKSGHGAWAVAALGWLAALVLLAFFLSERSLRARGIPPR